MAATAPDLRPRGAAELYDAALHLCARGETSLPGLALLGAVPVAGAGLWTLFEAQRGRTPWVPAALFALALMVRGVFQGAASLSALTALEGAPLSTGACGRQALGRAPSLMSSAGLAVVVNWVVSPALLFFASALWSGLLAAPGLVVRGEAGPWTAGRVGRRRLARSPAFGARALHGLAMLMTAVNLHSGLAMALFLAHTLFALDVTFLDQFASLRNGFYAVSLLAVTGVVLEPVKVALGVLLLVDARVRLEGLDLQAAVERLTQARKAGAAAAMLLALLAAGPAFAEPSKEALEDLDALVDAVGLTKDPVAIRALAAARHLDGPQAAALDRLLDRWWDVVEEGESKDVGPELRTALREQLNDLASAGVAAPNSGAARAAARRILADPDFETVVPAEKKAEGEPEGDPDSLWNRFWRWLMRQSCEPTERQKTAEPPGAGIGAGAFEVLTWVLIGLTVVAVLVILMRALAGRRDEAPAEASVAAGADAAEPVHELSALARAPEGWFSEADRLAQDGRYREAMRALYLAVLAALHRSGHIDYEQTRSNWDYCRAFKGARTHFGAFRELTRRFDFVWYGRTGADLQSYARFREMSAPILAPEAGHA